MSRPGAPSQELLSGIREPEKFDKLRDYLRAFDDIHIDTADYEEAARCNHRCRAHGIAGSPIDFLICAVADRRRWQIFTTDTDFENYQKVLGLQIFQP